MIFSLNLLLRTGLTLKLDLPTLNFSIWSWSEIRNINKDLGKTLHLYFRIKMIIYYKQSFFVQKTIRPSFSMSISKTFFLLQFLFKPLLKRASRSLKWGFLTLIWKSVLDFIILKWIFPHKFRAISALFPRLPRFPRYFCDFRGLEMGFPFR